MTHPPTARPTYPSRPERKVTMPNVLTRHLHLASVRDMDWVTAHFGHR
jgi:hypothetical protein